MIFMSNKDNQTVWNKHMNFYVFDTVKVLVTFQSYSDSEGLSYFSKLFRLWLWTSDFDCYELNGACQLSLIDYY